MSRRFLWNDEPAEDLVQYKINALQRCGRSFPLQVRATMRAHCLLPAYYYSASIAQENADGKTITLYKGTPYKE